MPKFEVGLLVVLIYTGSFIWDVVQGKSYGINLQSLLGSKL